MDALSHARELLPVWVPWAGPLAYLLLTAALTYLSLRVWGWVLLRPLRKARAAAEAASEELHWTEEARHGWAVRRHFAGAILLNAVAFGAFSMMWRGPLLVLGPFGFGILCGLLSLVVGVEVFRRRITPEVTQKRPSVRDTLADTSISLFVLRPTVSIAVVAAIFAPREVLSVEAALWLALTGLAVACAYMGLHLHLFRLIGLVKAAPPRLRAVVDRVLGEAEEAEREEPLRGLFLLRWTMSNAMAFPMARMMAFSEGALQEHEDDELEAIAAHELGHLREPLRARLVRLLPGFLMVGLAASPTLIPAYGPAPLVGLLVGFVILSILMRRFAHKMEEHADDHAKDHDEEVYARALERLHRFNGIPAVMGVKRTHPDLYDRLTALGRPPSYPRPAPPPRIGLLWAVLSLFVTTGLLMALSFLAYMPVYTGEDPLFTSELALSLGSGESGRDLAMVAFTRARAGETAEGDSLFDAAEAIADRPEDAIALRVWSLAEQGRCAEAEARYQAIFEGVGLEALDSADWDTAVEQMSICRMDAGEFE